MSRKWERMVSKNSKTVNKQRKKYGKEAIAEPGKDIGKTFKGRSWIFPAFLIAFGFVYLLFFRGLYEKDSTSLLIAVMYILLGLFMYWVRRPVLQIGKTKLSSRRFSGDKEVGPSDIERIVLTPSAIMIQLKAKQSRWVFTKSTQWFPVAEASAKLREFASHNHVSIVEETK